jgi:hypothetical protein
VPPLRLLTAPPPQPVAAITDLPLPVPLLEPIGEGIASCSALWEPLADAAVAGPVPLVATDGYEVRLECHLPGHRLEPRAPGTAHIVTVVRGSLRVPGEPTRIVPAGATAVIATATDAVVENTGAEVALAVHVRSTFRRRNPELPMAAADSHRPPAGVAGAVAVAAGAERRPRSRPGASPCRLPPARSPGRGRRGGRGGGAGRHTSRVRAEP